MTYYVLVDYSNGYWIVRGLNDFNLGNPHGRRFHMRDLGRMRGVIAGELNRRRPDEDWTCQVLYTQHAWVQPWRLGQERIEIFSGVGMSVRKEPPMRVNFGAIEKGHEIGP